MWHRRDLSQEQPATLRGRSGRGGRRLRVLPRGAAPAVALPGPEPDHRGPLRGARCRRGAPEERRPHHGPPRPGGRARRVGRAGSLWLRRVSGLERAPRGRCGGALGPRQARGGRGPAAGGSAEADHSGNRNHTGRVAGEGGSHAQARRLRARGGGRARRTQRDGDARALVHPDALGAQGLRRAGCGRRLCEESDCGRSAG